MRVLHQIAGHLAVFARARRNRLDLVNCEYCLDIGSALARGYGPTASEAA